MIFKDDDLSTDDDPVPPIGVQNAPAIIWLVVGELDETSDFQELAEGENITWCEDQQFEHDVKYVRADLVEKMKDTQ